MSVEHHLRTCAAGSCQQRPDPHFYMVIVSVGEKKRNTAKAALHDLRRPERAAIPVTVTGYLHKGELGVFFLNNATIFIMIAQVHDRRGLQFLHAMAHKLQGRVGIGHD